PSEAQWQRAAAVQADGSLSVSGLDTPPAEWTRTQFGPLPYTPADGREDPSRATFGVSWVVRGGGAAPLVTRVAADYALTDPGIGFRCAKELPWSVETLASLVP
ncbi:MAG: hypothetical protein IT356_13155, partial [Gemmatimonadaceae bacterium]|nr:hypothetical protein [Gemmatimonadaceae bacterium]